MPGEAYELWARLPAGSKWRAFELTGDVDVPPAVAVEVAMDVAADVSRAARGETRRLLLRTPDVIVTYIRVDFPMVADRDVTTRLERTHDVRAAAGPSSPSRASARAFGRSVWPWL